MQWPRTPATQLSPCRFSASLPNTLHATHCVTKLCEFPIGKWETGVLTLSTPSYLYIIQENSMSTIDGLNGNSAVSAYQYSGSNAVAGQSPNSQQGPGAAGASKFADAISAALSQVTGSSSSTGTTASSASTSGTCDSSQAEATFAQNLFAALQSQAGGAAASGTGSTAASGAAPAGGHHHHHGGGGGGKISSGLDSLASALTASSSNTSTTDSSTDASDTTGSDPLSALQASFNNLLAANGQSSSSASLPQFLQTLSQNLQNAPATGNVVSTKV